MDYGSKYTYIADNALEEADAVMEADVEQNLFNQVDSFSDFTFSSPSNAPAPPPAPSAKPEAKKKLVRVRNADTNVISVNFGTLVSEAQIATGDAVFCTNCKAAFGHISTLSSSNGDKMEIEGVKSEKQEVGEGSQIWNCEYCGTSNEVHIEPEEIPKVESLDYIIGAPSQKAVSADENLVLFCIDISGSMGVSYEVSGKFQLKGQEKVDKLASLNTERTAFGAFADQWLPNERRDITYVTRLQCVQAAISAQIEQMKKENPKRRVGIVTFNNEVTIYGDGTSQPEIVTGDKLSNFDELIKIGEKHELKQPIKDTNTALSQKLFSLEESGSTALGPALVTSLGICSRFAGSTIVICTDGLSNVGLGSLDDLWTDEEKEKASQFYEQVGHLAKSKGIIISVVSIKGSDCSIENLGALSELTAGAVQRVDPLTLSKNFETILSNPVIAINVSCSMMIHKGLYFRNDEEQETQKNIESKEIGNVTKDSTITFEYGVRSSYKKEEFSKLKFLPFQLQIKYTRMDGMKCMRVITRSQKITFDRKEAEENANIDVLGVNAVQQTAQIASKGSYTKARLYNVAQKQMLSRTAQNEEQKKKAKQWGSVQKKFEDEFSGVAKKEKEEGLNLSDDEDDMFEEKDEKEKEKMKEKKIVKLKARKAKRSDSNAYMLYNMKATSKVTEDDADFE